MCPINLDYNQIESQLSTLKVNNWRNEASFRDFLFHQINVYGKLHKYPLENFCFVNMHYLRPKSDKTIEGVNNRIRIPIYSESKLNSLISEYETTVAKYDTTSDHFASLMIRDDWPSPLRFYINMKEDKIPLVDNSIHVSRRIIEVLKNVDIDVDPDTFDTHIDSKKIDELKSSLDEISKKLCPNCKNTACSKGAQLLKEMFGTFNLTLRAINKNYFDETDGIFITLIPLQIKYNSADDVIAVLINISKADQPIDENLSETHQLFLPLIHGVHHREFLLTKKSEELKKIEVPVGSFSNEIKNNINSQIERLSSEVNTARGLYPSKNNLKYISDREKKIKKLKILKEKYRVSLQNIQNLEQLNQIKKNFEGEINESGEY